MGSGTHVVYIEKKCIISFLLVFVCMSVTTFFHPTGLCLYGHDIDETTTPVEASLAWTIGKARRTERPNFLGASTILDQLNNKTDTKRRVGLVVDSPAPAREGMNLVASGESTGSGAETIGVVTSGRQSPILRSGYQCDKYCVGVISGSKINR